MNSTLLTWGLIALFAGVVCSAIVLMRRSAYKHGKADAQRDTISDTLKTQIEMDKASARELTDDELRQRFKKRSDT